ncbi:MAG: hypothetical protein ACI4AH_02405 [Muribaculaceae bacterium]
MAANTLHINIGQRMFALLFVFAVGYLHCGSTLFAHYHIVDNVKVWHSHPFTGTQHGSSQVIFAIAHLNQMAAVVDNAATLDEPIEWVRELEQEPVACSPVKSASDTFNRRGPPVC